MTYSLRWMDSAFIHMYMYVHMEVCMIECVYVTRQKEESTHLREFQSDSLVLCAST